MINKSTAIRPEDILADGIDKTIINGTVIRKGTVAAFLANIDIFESVNTNDQQKQDALQMLHELAPSIIAVGLQKHVVFKNPIIQQTLLDAGA